MGPLLRQMGLVMVVACVGSGLSGQAGAVRLLYSMGRDGVVPRTIFGRLDARGCPAWNTAILGASSLAGAWLVSYERAAEVLNFGAFLGFPGVNAAAIREYSFRRRTPGEVNWWLDLAIPELGFLCGLAIWLNLARPAQVAGGIWLLAGIVCLAILTRGFCRPPASLDLAEGPAGPLAAAASERPVSPSASLCIALFPLVKMNISVKPSPH